MIKTRHLFGPVPSRRLGRSLGIDLVPLKTCSYNCVFCQAGLTDHQTLERKEYVPFDEVMAEFSLWRDGGGAADVATLSGSGEPTLHTRFGDVSRQVKESSGLRTVLLTNGSLLFMPEVREAAGAADIVKVSLSAWDDDTLRKLVRPHADLTFERVVHGIRTFADAFENELWIEVFVVPGVNDSEEGLRRIAAITDELGPDQIHLNTAVRPPAESTVKPLAAEKLAAYAELFTPKAEVLGKQAPDVETGETVGKRPVLGEEGSQS